MSGIQTISTPVRYASTTNSTNLTTGSLIIFGGVSLQGNLRPGSNISIHNSTNISQITVLSTDETGIFY